MGISTKPLNTQARHPWAVTHGLLQGSRAGWVELLPGGPPCPEGASWVALGRGQCPSHSPISHQGLWVGPRLPTLPWRKTGLRQGGVVMQRRLVPCTPSGGGEQPAEEEEGRLCSAP